MSSQEITKINLKAALACRGQAAGWVPPQLCHGGLFSHSWTLHFLANITTHFDTTFFTTTSDTAHSVTKLSMAAACCTSQPWDLAAQKANTAALQRYCQNVKFYVHLLSAAELNQRKGGGQAGPRSLYRLKGWECPREAGHWHLTKCFPKEKKAARDSYPCVHECHRSSKH